MAQLPRRWLTQDEQQLWRSYLYGYFRLNAFLEDNVMKHSGFDMLTYEILVRLSESPHRAMRMKDLAQSVSAAKSRLTYRITQLEEKRWVKRTGVEGDRRGQMCTLTDTGFEVLKDAAPHHVEAVLSEFIEAIPPAKVKELTSLLNAIAADVQ